MSETRLFLARLGVCLGIVAVLICLLAVPVHNVREAAARSSCNMGPIALAFHCYHDEHGHLPPAIVYDKDGRPLHSWRVLILPYLEANDLYKEFRLDEPWDSPHNLALLPQMPNSYAGPKSKASRLPPHHTVYQVFVGKGTAFEEKQNLKLSEGIRDTVPTAKAPLGLKMPDDFPDGTTHTLLFVEAGEPVPWTKPSYLPFDPDGPLPELRGLFRDGFRSCVVASSYRFIHKGTSEATLRALITRNGGDDPEVDW